MIQEDYFRGGDRCSWKYQFEGFGAEEEKSEAGK